MNFSKNKVFLIIFIFIVSQLLIADVHILNNGEALVGNNGTIVINGSLYDNSASQLKRVKFVGGDNCQIQGNPNTEIEFLTLAKDTLSILTLDSQLNILSELILESGIMGSTARSIDKIGSEIKNRKKIDTINLSKKVNTNLFKENGDNTRTGSLWLADDSDIRVYNGELLTEPNYDGFVNLFYYATRTTGQEIPVSFSVLKDLSILNSETITLGSDCVVNDTLFIDDGFVDTDGYAIGIRETAIVSGSPDNINGDIIGENIAVGTSSYANAAHGIAITAGNNIGNFRSILFLSPVTIGSDEGIYGRWRLESDISPTDRDLTFYWPSDADNGVSNSNIQSWKSTDTGNSWHQIGDSGASYSNPRSLTVNDVTSFSDWTIAEPYFQTNPSQLDFGDVTVGSSVILQFVLTNDRSETISGSINTPTDFVITSARNRDQIQYKNTSKDNNRNSIVFNIAPGGNETYNVEFSPISGNAYDDVIDISLLAAGNPSGAVSVIGQGLLYPDIDFNPIEFTEVLLQDSTLNTYLQINNLEGMDLVYTAGVSYESGSRDSYLAFPVSSNYWTGSCTNLTKTDISEVRGYVQEDGWMKFDISGIPENATINSVEFRGFVNTTYYPYWSITPVTVDPVSASAADLNADIIAEQFTGSYLYQNESVSYETGWKSYMLGGTINGDLETAAGIQDWFAVGIVSRDNSATYYINFDGWNEFNHPYLVIDYTVSSPYNWLTINSTNSIIDTLSAGDYHLYNIDFDASGLVDGDYNANIIITSNDPDEAYSEIPVSLNVSTPGILVSTASIDFGNVLVGQDSTVQFSIESTGDATLSGTIDTPDYYTVSLVSRRGSDSNVFESREFGRNVLPYTIEPGITQYYNLTFNPPNADTYSGNVVITHNAPGEDETIAVSGTGVEPDISINPDYFSVVLANYETDSEILTIENIGDVDLDYTATIEYSTRNSNEALFTSEANNMKKQIIDYDPSNYPTPRQGGEDVNSAVGIFSLPFTISGTTSGYVDDYDEACPYQGSTSPDVVYAYTAPTDMSINIDLCGSSYDTKLYVYENSVTPGSPFACNDDEYYGAPCGNYVSALFDLNLTNGNTYYIVIDGYGGDSGIYQMEITTNWLTLDDLSSVSGSVIPSDYDEISVGFNALGLDDGIYNANIRIDSNDPDQPIMNIPVTMQVSTAGISVSTENIDFGNVPVGQSSSLQFSIENTGTGTLTGDITTPNNYEVYQVTADNGVSNIPNENRNTIPYTIYSGNIQYFDLFFNPPSWGQYDGDVTITHNAYGGNKIIAVTGTGVEADISVNPNSFSTTLANYETYSEPLTISNSGNINLDYTATVEYQVRRSNNPIIPANITDKIIIEYDPSNYSAPIRQGGEVISSAFVINSLPFSDTGTTSGYNDDYDEACPYTGSTSPDVVYVYTPNGDMMVDITLCNGSAYDTKLYVYENSATPGTPYACNDDECPGYVSELIGLSLTGGNDYYFIIDGYGGASGNYIIDITMDENWLTLDNLPSVNGSVVPSDFDELSVGFDPLGLNDGIYSANIRIDSNDPDQPIMNIPVTMQVSTAGISVSTENIDFGNVPVGQNSIIQFSIENTGTGTLTGDITTPNNYEVLQVTADNGISNIPNENRNTITYTIYSGNIQYFDLTFTPPSWGQYDGNVTITHNASGGDKIIAVTGSGVEADITVNPNSFSTTLASYETHSEPLTISNSGNINLDYTATVEYSARGSNSPMIPSNMLEKVIIEYDPSNYPTPRQGGDNFLDATEITSLPFSNTGTTSGYIDDYDEACPYTGSTAPDVVYSYTPAYDANVSIDLCGSAYDTKLYVYENNINWLVDCNDDYYYYGDPCGSYVSALFDLQLVAGNTYFIIIDGYGGGSGNYEIEVTSTNWLTLDNIPIVNGSIIQNDFDEISVGFDVSGLDDGIYNANIRIDSNDPDQPIINVPVNLQVSTPAISVNPLNLDFGDILIGESDTKSFTIENTGNATLSGQILSSEPFVLEEVVSSGQTIQNPVTRNTLDYSIETGIIEYFNLTFTPTNEQGYNGAVAITDNIPDSDEEIILTGGGVILVAPTVSISIFNPDIELSWDDVFGAVSYKIYRSDDPNTLDWGTPIDIVTDSHFIDEDAALYQQYFYYVVSSTEEVVRAK